VITGQAPSFSLKVMKYILGEKIGMTEVFDESGKVIPVTLVQAGPCEVLDIKTKDRDKYEAIQIGYGKIVKAKKIKKTMKGKEFIVLREFKDEIANYKKGDVIDVSKFAEGDKVKVAGISKGKGFQGGVKRHGFSGRNATHGAKHEQRTMGSFGQSNIERVMKGKRMAGRMGNERVTVSNLKVVKVDKDNNILILKGAVPGRRGTLLEIKA